MYIKHSWQDFWVLLCYFKAFVRVEYLSFCPKSFLDESLIVYVNDQVHTVSDYYLMHNEAYINLKNTISLSVFRYLVYSLLVSSVGHAVVSWFWIKMGRKKQATKILSGFECVLPKALIKLVRKAGASPYTVGTVPIPKNAELQHMMVTGTTGTGKSNMIHQLLQQIREQGDQAIVVDTTGGIFARLYDARTDLLLNPLDIRSAKWNLWDEVTNGYVLDEIAEAMIPDTKSMDSFWITGARQLLVGPIRYLQKKENRSYENLVKMTLTISLKELQRRLVDATVSALLDPAML